MPSGRCRREAIGMLAKSAAALACAGIAGCKPAAPPKPEARIAIASLANGRRVIVTPGSEPVEVFQTADGIQARILVCTHFGCVVAWDAGKRQYVCPCHEGRFNEAGVPVAGPPLGPLRVAVFRIEGAEVVVEGHAVSP